MNKHVQNEINYVVWNFAALKQFVVVHLFYFSVTNFTFSWNKFGLLVKTFIEHSVLLNLQWSRIDSGLFLIIRLWSSSWLRLQSWRPFDKGSNEPALNRMVLLVKIGGNFEDKCCIQLSSASFMSNWWVQIHMIFNDILKNTCIWQEQIDRMAKIYIHCYPRLIFKINGC